MDPTDPTEIRRRVRDAYNQIAPTFYRTSTPGTVPPNLLKFAEHTAAQTRAADGWLIDVGCGVGTQVKWFESRGVRVVGVDLSAQMLALARRDVTRPLSLMNMDELGFGDAQFAAVWCQAALLHLPKAEAPRALGEMRRVLRAGGLLTLSIQEGDFEGWNGGYVEGVTRFFARYGVDEMTALLSSCGFLVRDIQVEPMPPRTWLAFSCVAASREM